MPETTQRKRVPVFIAKQYVGGARAFKSERRAALRRIKSVLPDLRAGCAYFPSGTRDVEALAEAVARIERDISIANWGR